MSDQERTASGSAPVRMYLSVHHGGAGNGGWMGASGTLYTRVMHTAFMPREGDDVALWFDPEDAPDGPRQRVRRHWWTADGRVAIEFVPIHVDPDEVVAQGIQSNPGRLPYRTGWWTANDGELESRLLAGGWRLYGDEPTI